MSNSPEHHRTPDHTEDEKRDEMSFDTIQQRSVSRVSGGHVKGVLISVAVIAVLIGVAAYVIVWYRKKYHKK